MNIRTVPKLDDYVADIERLAHSYAIKLIRAGRLSPHEQGDFVQDLLVHVVKHWPELAGNDFEPLGFAQLIITQKSSNELRRRHSLKAKFSREPVAVNEQIAAGLAGVRHESAVPLDSTLGQLSPEDRQFVELIVQLGPERTARQLGLSARQVAKRRQRIGRQLERLL